MIPIAVAKATITPVDGAPIVKYVKIILAKTGLLPKGVIAKNGITWNGHPIANSYVSSATPGVAPFAAYNVATARANTTLGSLYGPDIDLGSQGVVSGNVMLGPGVTLTGSGTVTGQTIGNLSYNFTMPTYPTNTGATGYVNLGSTIPATLPRAADLASPAADGRYYYFVSGATIGATTVSAGKNVVLVGTSTSMAGGLMVQAPASGPCGSMTIFMDGPMSPGNSDVNTTSWAGALQISHDHHADLHHQRQRQFLWLPVCPQCRVAGQRRRQQHPGPVRIFCRRLGDQQRPYVLPLRRRPGQSLQPQGVEPGVVDGIAKRGRPLALLLPAQFLSERIFQERPALRPALPAHN